MTEPSPVDSIVVGAGLAGLAAANAINRAGRSVVVLEASDDVGGRVRSDHVDGFTLDRGFQVLLTAYPDVASQLDVPALNLRRFDPGAMVWLDGRGHLIGDPLRMPSTLWSSAVAPIGSLADKIRFARLQRRVRRTDARQLLRADDATTIDQLRVEGFSTRMIDRFLRPLFAGIQLDPQLTTSRRMFDVILQSLSRGDSGVPELGMGAISQQLAQRLPLGAVRLSSPVTHVAPGLVTRADGTQLAASSIVVATEGPVASRLVGIPTVNSLPVGCVYFAADVAPTNRKLIVLDGTSRGPALNVAVMSNIAPSYAPPGRHLIAAATPGDIGDDLEGRVQAQLRAWWGPAVDSWTHLRTYRIAHGQPVQQPPFSPKRRVAIGEGLFVCGDHRDTASIQGALFSGRRCGEAVVAASG